VNKYVKRETKYR